MRNQEIRQASDEFEFAPDGVLPRTAKPQRDIGHRRRKSEVGSVKPKVNLSDKQDNKRGGNDQGNDHAEGNRMPALLVSSP